MNRTPQTKVLLPAESSVPDMDVAGEENRSNSAGGCDCGRGRRSSQEGGGCTQVMIIPECWNIVLECRVVKVTVTQDKLLKLLMAVTSVSSDFFT